MAALQSGGIDPVNVERVEVLKGPSGALFGSSLISFGGFSNLVTKKPFDAVKGDITYTTGQWGLNRLAADVNTPLNQNPSLLMRVNAAVHTERSFQSYGASRNFALAPGFSYKGCFSHKRKRDCLKSNFTRFLPGYLMERISFMQFSSRSNYF